MGDHPFEKVLENDPRHPPIHKAIGESWYEIGKLEGKMVYFLKSIKHLEKATEYKPMIPVTVKTLGMVLFRLAQMEKGIRTYSVASKWIKIALDIKEDEELKKFFNECIENQNVE